MGPTTSSSVRNGCSCRYWINSIREKSNSACGAAAAMRRVACPDFRPDALAVVLPQTKA